MIESLVISKKGVLRSRTGLSIYLVDEIYDYGGHFVLALPAEYAQNKRLVK